jgi:hypothetical protein
MGGVTYIWRATYTGKFDIQYEVEFEAVDFYEAKMQAKYEPAHLVKLECISDYAGNPVSGETDSYPTPEQGEN